MKSIYLYFLVSLLACSGLFSQKPQAELRWGPVSPVVDGEIDSIWTDATSYNINLPYYGESPSLGETTWKGTWDLDGFYFLIEVEDDSLVPYYSTEPPLQNWMADNSQLFLDVNFNLEDGQGPAHENGHYLFWGGLAESTENGQNTSTEQGIEYAFTWKESGYIEEFFIPFDLLNNSEGKSIDLTAEIGFDVNVIDNDGVYYERNRAVWANAGTLDDSWNNMDDCGIITFICGSELVLINEIELIGGSIDEENGTLQMVANILPANATFKDLKWWVKNTTGRAEIDEQGLLTATQNGEVWVFAESRDRTGIKDSVKVTITNQLAIGDEVNLIKNGKFDELEDNAKAKYWVAITDAAPEPVVLNGVSVHDAILQDDYWYYRFYQDDLGALPDTEYTLKFKMWADKETSVRVNFRDYNNGYVDYGKSEDSRSFGGFSDWIFDITTSPTFYEVDVVFDQIKPNTLQKLLFNFGLSGTIVYLDEVSLVQNDFTPRVEMEDQITIACGDSVLISPVLKYGGDESLSFAWTPESGLSLSNSLITKAAPLENTLYTLHITSETGIDVSQSILINVDPIKIDARDVMLPCGSTKEMGVSLNAGSDALSYTWVPSLGLSADNILNPKVNIMSDQSYTLTVSHPNGCNASEEIHVFMKSTEESPEICAINVDEEYHNVIQIKKTESTNIESYFVYRESSIQANEYDLIATLAYAESSEYTDTLSNARVKSHKYKIAIKDICGFLTSKSESHKTMHLIAYKVQANEWNLIWEPYEGVPISSYKIFRGEDINSLELIDNVSSSGHSYTDINAPEKDLLYQVEAVFTNPCIIANSEMFSSSKSNFYNTIYSSLDRNIKVKSSNFLYPNPAHDILYCNFSFSQNSRLIIYNVYGSLLLDERLKLSNDISDLPEGIYFVKILDKGEMYQSRLVVLKK